MLDTDALKTVLTIKTSLSAINSLSTAHSNQSSPSVSVQITE